MLFRCYKHGQFSFKDALLGFVQVNGDNFASKQQNLSLAGEINALVIREFLNVPVTTQNLWMKVEAGHQASRRACCQSIYPYLLSSGTWSFSSARGFRLRASVCPAFKFFLSSVRKKAFHFSKMCVIYDMPSSAYPSTGELVARRL